MTVLRVIRSSHNGVGQDEQGLPSLACLQGKRRALLWDDVLKCWSKGKRCRDAARNCGRRSCYESLNASWDALRLPATPLLGRRDSGLRRCILYSLSKNEVNEQ
jgi:hypothetical protein